MGKASVFMESTVRLSEVTLLLLLLLSGEVLEADDGARYFPIVLCAFIFSTVSGDQYPQVREHALRLVPAHSECSSVRVDCWRSSSSFQNF